MGPREEEKQQKPLRHGLAASLRRAGIVLGTPGPAGLVQPASRALPRPEAAGSPTHFQEQGPEAPVRVAAEAPGCAVVSKDVPSPPPSQSLELSRSLGFSWL